MQPRPDRLLAIDVLRGAAIVWVIAYHLWTDLRFPDVYPYQSDAFREVIRQLGDADVPGALAAACEAVLRVGYMGVPLFMMLSGISLSLVATRRGSLPRHEWRHLPRRLRRLLAPYWVGFAITIAFAAALAFTQWQRHGGAPLGDYLRNGDIDLHRGQLVSGGLLFPRLFGEEWQFAPEGSLWFVLVVVQYYVLFPPLFAALRRVGAPLFLASALVVNTGALAVMVAANGDLFGGRTWIEMGAPFRIAEFAAGMCLGVGFASRPRGLAGLAPPAAHVAIGGMGASAFIAGCLIAPDRGYLSVLQWPLIVGGLAAWCFVLLSVAPSRLAAVGPARALAWLGVASYAALIISEPLRSVTHTMRAEGASGGWIAVWVVAGFVPLILLLARPLAIALGLIERTRPALTIGELTGRDEVVPAAGPAVEAR